MPANQWATARYEAFEDLAFTVVRSPEEASLTCRGLFRCLRASSREYADDLGCAPDESPIDTFMEEAHDWDVVRYDHQKGRYELGKLGRVLIDQQL